VSLASGAPRSPALPPGRDLDLGERGTPFIRELPGPTGAPTVVLLHGWTATADINWYPCYSALSERYRVIAFDHRGHGRGIRSRRTFRLEDCADDVAVVTEALGVDTFVPVGYSMGGPIAQLTWRRHRDRVDGLVLCATTPYFAGKRPERLSFVGLTGLATLARFTPSQARDWITDQVYLQRKSANWGDWATEQVANHDWKTILQAGKAIGEFSSSDWVSEIDVPTSVVVTMNDPVVPLRRQAKLFDWIPDAEAFRVEGGHDAVVSNSKRFVPQLLRGVDSVQARVRA
jgi:3-oxoadipate enol-lactonase